MKLPFIRNFAVLVVWKSTYINLLLIFYISPQLLENSSTSKPTSLIEPPGFKNPQNQFLNKILMSSENKIIQNRLK